MKDKKIFFDCRCNICDMGVFKYRYNEKNNMIVRECSNCDGDFGQYFRIDSKEFFKYISLVELKNKKEIDQKVRK